LRCAKRANLASLSDFEGIDTRVVFQLDPRNARLDPRNARLDPRNARESITRRWLQRRQRHADPRPPDQRRAASGPWLSQIGHGYQRPRHPRS
jgi:hypothetical protein